MNVLRRLLMPFVPAAPAPAPAAAPKPSPSALRDAAMPSPTADAWWCLSCRTGAGGAWCGRCGARCRALGLGAFNVDVIKERARG